MTTAFSTELRVLTCPHCGAPIQAALAGGQIQCTYCHASIVVAARSDAAVRPFGPAPTEAERYQGLWTQARAFGAKILPPEMHQVLHGGPLTPDRVGAALALWRSYLQRATAGDSAMGDLAVLLTGSLSGYFAMANDPQRQRAAFESALDALREPAQKQVIRCNLARASVKAGDLRSAGVWFGACDPSPVDLQADTAYRVTYATLATAHGDFRNVLAALGNVPGSVPIAMTSQLQSDVLRANAIEKSGDVATATTQLVASARSLPGGLQAIPDIVAVNAHLRLCPQSLPQAMAALRS